jgi:MerC mercury resistance protein
MESQEIAMLFMLKSNMRDWRWDGFGLGIAGLCLVHCLATSIFLALFAAAGGALVHPAIHEIGLVLAIGFGILALGQGIFQHGFILPASIGALGIGIMGGALTLPHGDIEVFYTVLGVAVLAFGHTLNHRASN